MPCVHAGEDNTIRAYRMSGPISTYLSPPKPAGISELLYQIQRSVSCLWASGGGCSDFNLHQIDVIRAYPDKLVATSFIDGLGGEPRHRLDERLIGPVWLRESLPVLCADDGFRQSLAGPPAILGFRKRRDNCEDRHQRKPHEKSHHRAPVASDGIYSGMSARSVMTPQAGTSIGPVTAATGCSLRSLCQIALGSGAAQRIVAF